MNLSDKSKVELLLELKTFRARVAELERYVAERGWLQEPPQEDLSQIQNALEELRVAEEELRQQNEELLFSRQAEEEMRQLFQGLFEFAPDGYLVTDTAGTIQKANRSASALLNVSAEYLAGKPLVLFIDEERRAEFHSLFSGLIRSGHMSAWEAPVQTGGDDHFHASITASALHDRQGAVTGLCWLIHDITERKKAEGELEEAKLEAERGAAELKAVFDAMNDPVLVYDAKGTLLRTNAALKNFYGLDPDGTEWDKQGEVFRKFLPRHPDGQPLRQDERPVNRALQGETVRNELLVVADHTGRQTTFTLTSAPIIVGGKITGAVSVNHDITEMKKAEQAILRSKEEWEATFNAVPDLIAILDTQHRVVRVNKAMAERLGLPPDRCEGLRCHEAVHGLSESPGFCPHALTCQDGKEHIAEVHEPRLGGHFLVSTTPLFDEGGEFIGAVHVARDITARKKSEEALRTSEERYRSLFDRMSEGFALHEIICDDKGEPCDYRFLEVNPAFERLTGLKRGYVIGETVREVLPEVESSWIRTYGAVALTGQPVRFEQYSSSLKRHYEVFAYCPAPRQFAVMFSDITERKNAGEAMRENRKDLNRAQAVAHTGSWRLDVRKNELLWSDETYRIFGIPNGTPLTYETFLAAVCPDDRTLVDQKWNAALSGEPYDVQHRTVVDGTIKWVRERAELEFDHEGKLRGGFGTVQDITERKQAEQQLQESLSILNATLESTADGILVTDTTGNIRDFNQKFLEMWGIPETVDKSDEDYEIRRHVLNQLKYPDIALRDAEWAYDHPGREGFSVVELKDGRVFEMYWYPHKLEGRTVGAVTSVRDITERKRMLDAIKESEQRLREQAARLQAVLDAAPVCVWITEDRECKSMWGNRIAYEMARVPQGTNVSKSSPTPEQTAHFRVFKDGVELEPRDMPLQRVAASGKELRDYTHDLVFEDGSVLSVVGNVIPLFDSAGKPAGAIAAFMDITERRQMVDALRESEERFRKVFENAAMGISVTDWEGHFEKCNPAYCAMLGYTEEELRRMDFASLVHPDDRAANMAEIRRLQAGEIPFFEVENRYIRKDGQPIWVQKFVSLLPDETGKPAHIMGLTTDVTERKQREEQIARQAAVLNAINKVFRETLQCEDIEEVARICLRVADNLTGSAFGFIVGVDEEGTVNAFALNDPGWAECRIPDSDKARMLKKMKLRGYWSKVITEGHSVIVNDPANHPDSVGTPEGHPPITAFLGVPLKHDGKILGMIALANRPGGYTRDNQKDLEALSFAFVEALDRKRADQELRETRDYLENLLTYANAPIIVWDPSFKITRFNHAFQRLAGYDARKVIGKNLYMLFPEATREESLKKIDRTLEGEYWETVEIPILRNDGQVRVVLWNSANIHAEDGKTVIATIAQGHDITERKRAEDALRESERNLAEAQKIAHIGSWEWEIDTGEVRWSDELYRIFGLHPQSFVPNVQRFLDMIYPDDRESMLRTINQAVSEGKPADLDFRIVLPDGLVRIAHDEGMIVKFDESGKPLRMVGTVQDITERKKAEEALKAARDEAENERLGLEAVMEALPVGVSILDKRGGKTRANKMFDEVWGARAGATPAVRDVSGYAAYKAWWPETGKLVQPEEWAAAQALEKGETVAGQLFEIQRFDGTHGFVLNSAAAVRDSDGNITGSAVAIQDITELRRTQDALRESETRYRQLSESLGKTVREQVEQLRQVESLAAIGRMVSVVAHEVRNPLQNIRLGMDVFRSMLSKDEEKLEILGEIEHGVNLLNDTVDELLDYSRPVRLEYASWPVEEIVGQALKSVPHKLHNIKTNVELEKEDREIFVDAPKMVRVLVNIITNAAEAMHDGGNLEIASALPSKRRVCLSISDTGLGMDAETLEKLFEPFHTTKTQGTGLGLAISKKIIEAHDGRVTVKSKPNKGTTVKITLPIAPKKENKPRRARRDTGK